MKTKRATAIPVRKEWLPKLVDPALDESIVTPVVIGASVVSAPLMPSAETIPAPAV